jgi:hypothetical protein
MGTMPTKSSMVAPGASLVMPAVLAMGPGATPLTRMPYSPHSSASVRVIESMAALAADA